MRSQLGQGFLGFQSKRDVGSHKTKRLGVLVETSHLPGQGGSSEGSDGWSGLAPRNVNEVLTRISEIKENLRPPEFLGFKNERHPGSFSSDGRLGRRLEFEGLGPNRYKTTLGVYSLFLGL